MDGIFELLLFFSCPWCSPAAAAAAAAATGELREGEREEVGSAGLVRRDRGVPLLRRGIVLLFFFFFFFLFLVLLEEA